MAQTVFPAGALTRRATPVRAAYTIAEVECRKWASRDGAGTGGDRKSNANASGRGGLAVACA
jgi:hypothetical protein